MKYIALVFCLLSLGLMTCLFAYAYGIRDVPSHDFQGGPGFAMNAPIWGFGILALLAAVIGAPILLITALLHRATFAKSLAFWTATAALVPVTAFWIRVLYRIAMVAGH